MRAPSSGWRWPYQSREETRHAHVSVFAGDLRLLLVPEAAALPLLHVPLLAGDVGDAHVRAPLPGRTLHLERDAGPELAGVHERLVRALLLDGACGVRRRNARGDLLLDLPLHPESESLERDVLGDLPLDDLREEPSNRFLDARLVLVEPCADERAFRRRARAELVPRRDIGERDTSRSALMRFRALLRVHADRDLRSAEREDALHELLVPVIVVADAEGHGRSYATRKPLAT